jgi:hypothetical protein
LHTPEYDGLSDAENWIVDVISVYTSEHEENCFDWRLMSAIEMFHQLTGSLVRSGLPTTQQQLVNERIALFAQMNTGRSHKMPMT